MVFGMLGHKRVNILNPGRTVIKTILQDFISLNLEKPVVQSRVEEEISIEVEKRTLLNV